MRHTVNMTNEELRLLKRINKPFYDSIPHIYTRRKKGYVKAVSKFWDEICKNRMIITPEEINEKAHHVISPSQMTDEMAARGFYKSRERNDKRYVKISGEEVEPYRRPSRIGVGVLTKALEHVAGELIGINDIKKILRIHVLRRDVNQAMDILGWIWIPRMRRWKKGE